MLPALMIAQKKNNHSLLLELGFLTQAQGLGFIKTYAQAIYFHSMCLGQQCILNLFTANRNS